TRPPGILDRKQNSSACRRDCTGGLDGLGRRDFEGSRSYRLETPRHPLENLPLHLVLNRDSELVRIDNPLREYLDTGETVILLKALSQLRKGVAWSSVIDANAKLANIDTTRLC